MEQGLNLVADEKTKVLIVGTFPSILSREVCYYNNPQNGFWKIMSQICGNERLICASCAERYACLRQNGVGLWDVIKSCQFVRQSSSDNLIIKESIVFNNFGVLRRQCSALKAIVFSSRNAKQLFDKYLKLEADDGLKNWLCTLTNQGRNVLPSTSSAYSRMPLQEKIIIWQSFFTQYIK